MKAMRGHSAICIFHFSICILQSVVRNLKFEISDLRFEIERLVRLEKNAHEFGRSLTLPHRSVEFLFGESLTLPTSIAFL